MSSTFDIAPSSKGFVTETAITETFEIESSKRAEAQSNGPTKAFAEKMIADHTKTRRAS